MKNKFLAVIPARYASSRFPGKPLAKLGGVEMIIRVCERVSEAGIPCLVATDDERIFKCVEMAGYNAVMTSEACGSGTERVAEAYHNIQSGAEVVINIQGDEPFIHPDQIRSLCKIFEAHPDTQIATLLRPFPSWESVKRLEDPNLVKAVKAIDGSALYFSRSVIPYLRNCDREEWPKSHQYYTHIGIYAYKAEVLSEIVKLPVSPLEKAESLEQLRWLENGFRIRTSESDRPTIGIDTPADLEAAEEYLRIQNG